MLRERDSAVCKAETSSNVVAYKVAETRSLFHRGLVLSRKGLVNSCMMPSRTPVYFISHGGVSVRS